MTILKIRRFWPSSDRAPGADPAHAAEPEGLDAFGPEALPALAAGMALTPAQRTAPTPSTRPAPAGRGVATQPLWIQVATWAAVVVLTAGIAIASVIFYQRRFAAKATTGVLSVETIPANLEVLVAGKSVGRTPVTLPLAAGAYEIQVGDAAQRRTITATVTAGTTSVQHLEFAAPARPAGAETGTLRIQTEPPRLTVLVDGVDRGLSPVSIENIDATTHDIAVRTDHGVVHRSVKVLPRETISLIVAAGAPAPDTAAMTGGWLTVSSPIPMQLREGGKVIGTTESERVMLPAGEHEVEVLNEALGFRVVRKMRVTAGKTATTRIDLPNGSLSLNAQPWAEVWIDGERIGETPIGNLQRPIGTHQVTFRHPEFGERRESVVISLKQPARLGVDLRKKQ